MYQFCILEVFCDFSILACINVYFICCIYLYLCLFYSYSVLCFVLWACGRNKTGLNLKALLIILFTDKFMLKRIIQSHRFSFWVFD